MRLMSAWPVITCTILSRNYNKYCTQYGIAKHKQQGSFRIAPTNLQYMDTPQLANGREESGVVPVAHEMLHLREHRHPGTLSMANCIVAAPCGEPQNERSTTIPRHNHLKAHPVTSEPS
jgi:hypothetical protein